MRRLSAAAFLAYCSYAICRTPLLPLFARDLGAGPSLVGFVMGASTLTGILLELPAGALSDLLGRRRLLLAGALVFASLPFTYLAVSTLTVLIAVRFVHGSATAVFGPVASASLSDIAPPAKRGVWLTCIDRPGRRPGAWPRDRRVLVAAGRLDLAFVVAGTIGLGVPLIVAGWPGAPSSPSATRASWREFKRGVVEVGGDRRPRHKRRAGGAVRFERYAERVPAALRP